MLTLFAVALGGVLTGAVATLFGIWLWFKVVYTAEMTLVGEASYRVAIPGRSDVLSRIYALGYDGRYLLVLSSKSSEYPEPYYIDLTGRKIGLPNFGNYKHIPFLRCAFVHTDIHDGFPLDGAFVADWNVTNDWREVRIRITGYVQDEPGRSEETMKKHRPIAYGNEIILTGGW